MKAALPLDITPVYHRLAAPTERSGSEVQLVHVQRTLHWSVGQGELMTLICRGNRWHWSIANLLIYRGSWSIDNVLIYRGNWWQSIANVLIYRGIDIDLQGEFMTLIYRGNWQSIANVFIYRGNWWHWYIGGIDDLSKANLLIYRGNWWSIRGIDDIDL